MKEWNQSQQRVGHQAVRQHEEEEEEQQQQQQQQQQTILVLHGACGCTLCVDAVALGIPVGAFSNLK
jgi:hypothetical protein